MTKRTLAVVRCGDASLHRSWAVGSREIDVAVSYFGPDADRAFPEAAYVHRYKGGKWDGIHDFFRERPQLIDQYDTFWLPDDDIEMTAGAADRLIALGRANGLEIWQPALDERSYYGHVITLGIEGIALRHTNFVEIMAPVLSRALLRNTLPLFGTTKSGFGLDYLWPQRAAARADGRPVCAIVDAASATHTRPLGKVLRSAMAKSGGPTLRQEYAAILRLVTHRNPLFRSMLLAVPRKRVLGGVDLDGAWLDTRAVSKLSLRSLRTGQRVQPVGTWELFRYWATSLA